MEKLSADSATLCAQMILSITELQERVRNLEAIHALKIKRPAND